MVVKDDPSEEQANKKAEDERCGDKFSWL